MDEATIRLRSRCLLIKNPSLGVNSLTVKTWCNMLDVLILEIGNCAATDVRDAHSHGNAKHECSNHEPLAMLRALCVVRVDVHGVLIHGEEAEPGVIGLTNRATRPMLEKCAGLEFFKI